MKIVNYTATDNFTRLANPSSTLRWFMRKLHIGLHAFDEYRSNQIIFTTFKEVIPKVKDNRYYWCKQCLVPLKENPSLGVYKDERYNNRAYDSISKHVGKPNGPFKPPQTVVRYWLVAIDLHFEEMSIMRDGSERAHFSLSLGVEYNNLYLAKIDYEHECRK